MDPNNQAINNQQPNMQATQVPQNPIGQAPPQQPVQYQNPKGSSHKTILLLIILLIMVLGLAGYLVFANMNPAATPQNVPVSDVPVIPPTVTPTPTVAEDDFTIEDPEVDIKVLDDAAATL